VEVVELIAWASLLVGFIALVIFLAWRLYKMGKRRAAPGWWIAAILAAVLMLALPFVGFIVAVLVLFVDRNSAGATQRG
jgi:drug/metabolite transporter (DMT)-like permease